jgi:hypothetical protein
MKATPNWDQIEAEYRAGQLTNVQIAKQHGITEGAIRRRAKSRGWQRDLSARVQQQVRSELVRDVVRGEEGDRTEPRTEYEIVQAAAARAVEVVRQHRAHLATLYRISHKLAEGIESYLTGGKGRPHWIGERETITEAVFRLSQASSKWIPLERKAFSLDEATERDVNKLTDEQLESRITELLRKGGADRVAGGAEPAMGAGAA